ncbi:MAG: LysR family transcriptional regulator [Candidatus Thiodiazotropha endolucinida]
MIFQLLWNRPVKGFCCIAAFVAVAETGAFNRAAQKLGVKSSVTNHHLSRLELSRFKGCVGGDFCG